MEIRERRNRRNGSTTIDPTLTKINYLMDLIDHNIDLYASQFRKTERPKIEAILNYYGFNLGEDVEYRLYTNSFGNRELEFCFYFNDHFHMSDWTYDDNGHLNDCATISTHRYISY